MLKILLILLVGYIVLRMLAAWWVRHEERLRRKYWRRWPPDSPDRHRMRDEWIDAHFEEEREKREREQL